MATFTTPSDPQEAIKRLARAIRSEADEIEKTDRDANGGEWRDARPDDRDYRRGRADGLRQAGDLLDDGAGT